MSDLPAPTPRLLMIMRLATALTFGAVLMGAMVCATESGTACPNWPGCYPDQVLPVGELSPWIEFTHRIVAATSAPAVLIAAVAARRAGLGGRVVRLCWLALAGALAAGFFGMMIILFALPWQLGMLDLTAALVSMIAMLSAALLAGAPQRSWRPTSAGRLSWAGVAVLIVMHVSAIAVAGTGSFTRCLGWPILAHVAVDRWPALQVARLALAGVAAALLFASVRRAPGAARVHGWGLLALLGVEIVVGLVLRTPGHSEGLRSLYSAVAVVLLWSWALFAGRDSVRAWVRDAPRGSLRDHHGRSATSVLGG